MPFSASVVGRLIRFWLDFESKLTKTSISTVFLQRRLQAKLFCCLAQIFLMFRFFFSFDFDWFFQFAIYFTCYNSVFNRNNCNLDIYVYMASTDFNLGKKKSHSSYLLWQTAFTQFEKRGVTVFDIFLIYFGSVVKNYNWSGSSIRQPLVSYYLCLSEKLIIYS